MNLKQTRFRCAFTLIELLVVMAIVSILAVLLFPAIAESRRAARRTKAKAQVKGIETAFMAYYDEYKRWPSGLGNEQDVDGLPMDASVVQMLGGQDINSQNPRLVPFLDLPQGMLNPVGEYVDAWANRFRYMLDFDMDDKVDITFSNGQTNLNRVVAVWSQGFDLNDLQDDIRSW